MVGLAGVVCATTTTVTDDGVEPAVKLTSVFGPSNAYGVETANACVRVTAPRINAFPVRVPVMVTEFEPVCIVPFVIVKVPTFMLLFNVIAVLESCLLMANVLNVEAPLMVVGGTPPNSTVDVPALNVPLFVQLPNSTTFPLPPAAVALPLMTRFPLTLSVPMKVFAFEPPFVMIRTLYVNAATFCAALPLYSKIVPVVAYPPAPENVATGVNPPETWIVSVEESVTVFVVRAPLIRKE